MKKDTGLQELQEGYKSYTTTTLIVPVKKSECPRKRKIPSRRSKRFFPPRKYQQNVYPLETKKEKSKCDTLDLHNFSLSIKVAC